MGDRRDDGGARLLPLTLVGSVQTNSPALFLGALGVLVASKAYGVTKASAVPRVLPNGFTLVEGNSRLGLTGTAAAAVSAPIAVVLAQVGPEWALRYAFVPVRRRDRAGGPAAAAGGLLGR